MDECHGCDIIVQETGQDGNESESFKITFNFGEFIVCYDKVGGLVLAQDLNKAGEVCDLNSLAVGFCMALRWYLWSITLDMVHFLENE